MEWKISAEPVPYEEAVAFMEARAGAIREGKAGELVWLLEHPALFTAGSGAQSADLIDTLGLPVYATGRGGQYTYHGPGQRVAYVMLDLKNHGADVRLFVQKLEDWVIATLAALGLQGFTREGRVGVWVKTPSLPLPLGEADFVSEAMPSLRNPVRETASAFPSPNPLPEGEGFNNEAKIAAIGVRIRKWVSYHGISLNVNPDLSHYRGIVPCGIKEYGVTSLASLGIKSDMKMVDAQLMQSFDAVFGKQHSLASAESL